MLYCCWVHKKSQSKASASSQSPVMAVFRVFRETPLVRRKKHGAPVEPHHHANSVRELPQAGVCDVDRNMINVCFLFQTFLFQCLVWFVQEWILDPFLNNPFFFNQFDISCSHRFFLLGVWQCCWMLVICKAALLLFLCILPKTEVVLLLDTVHVSVLGLIYI